MAQQRSMCACWASCMLLVVLAVDIVMGDSYTWISGSGDFLDATKWQNPFGDNPGDFTLADTFFIVGASGNVTLTAGAVVGGFGLNPNANNYPILILQAGITVGNSLVIKNNGPRYPLIVSKYGFTSSITSSNNDTACTAPGLSGNCVDIVAAIQADGVLNLKATAGLSLSFNVVGDSTSQLFFSAGNQIYMNPAATLTLHGTLTTHIVTFQITGSQATSNIYVGSFNCYDSVGIVGTFPSGRTGILYLGGTINVFTGITSFGQISSGYSFVNNGAINIKNGAEVILNTQKFSCITGSITIDAGGQLTVLGNGDTEEGDITIGGLSGGGKVLTGALYSTFTGPNNIEFSIEGFGSSVMKFSGTKSTGCTFNVNSTCSGIFETGSSGGTFVVIGSVSLTGSDTHENPSFHLSSGANLQISAPVQNGQFILNGGSITISSTCTGCNIAGYADSLSITGAIPQTTISLTGGSSTISASSYASATSISITGGTAHQISGNVASTPLTVSGASTVVTLNNAQFTSGGKITLQSGTITISGSTTFMSTNVSITGGTFRTAASTQSTDSHWAVTGSGTLNSVSSSWTRGTISVTGTQFTTSGGTLTQVALSCASSCTFASTTTVTSLALTASGNAVVGPDTATLDLASLTWNGGDLQFTGVAQTSTLAPSGASAKISGILTLNGPTNWISGDITIDGQLKVNANSSLNLATGRIIGLAGSYFTLYGYLSCAEINTNNIAVGGTVDLKGNNLNTQILIFQGGNISNANINVATATSFLSGKNILTNCTFANGNALTVDGGLTLQKTTLVNTATGKMQINGPIDASSDSSIVNNGTITHSTTNSSTTFSIRIANSGTFANIGTGNLTITGLFTCDSGFLNVTNPVAAFTFSGQPLNLTNSCQLSGGGTFGFKNIPVTLTANLASANIEVAGDVSFVTQNIQKVVFTSGSITGTNLNVGTLAWTSGTLSVRTTATNLVLGGNMRLEANLTATTTTDARAANQVLFSNTPGIRLTSTTTTIGGSVTIDVDFASTGTITVTPSGSLTVNGAFICGANLLVNGYFAIKSPGGTNLTCTAAGVGTLATFTQLNISNSFTVATLLIAETTFSVNQPVTLGGLALNASNVVGTSNLNVTTLTIGAGESRLTGIKFSLTGTAVLDGSLILDKVALSCTGAISLHAGSKLTIGGTYTLSSACQVSGAGVLAANGNLTVGYPINVGGFSVTGGTLNLTQNSGNLTFSSFTLDSAQLVGSFDTLTITGSAGFTSIVLSTIKLILNGTTTFDGVNIFGTITNKGTLNIAGGQHTVTSFTNSGSITISESKKRATSPLLTILSQFTLTDGVLLNDGQIVNVNGSTFTITGGSFTGGSGTFTNNGSLIINSLQNFFQLDNFGGIHVKASTTTISGGGTFAGSLQIDTGAEVNLSGGSFTLLSNGTIYGNGTLSSSSDASLEGTVTVPLININGNSINFASNAISGVVNWNGGSIGFLNLANAGVMQVQGAAAKSLTGTINSFGYINFNASVAFLNNTALANNGSIDFNNTIVGNLNQQQVVGQIQNYGNLYIPPSAKGVGLHTTIYNYGSFVVAGSAFMLDSTHYGPNGTVVLLAPFLLQSQRITIQSGAVLSGTGNVTGTVANSGSVVIGNVTGTTPGYLNLTTYNGQATGTLYFDIFDLNNYDFLLCGNVLVTEGSSLEVNSRIAADVVGVNGLVIMQTLGGYQGPNFNNKTTPGGNAGELKYNAGFISFVSPGAGTSQAGITTTSGTQDRTAVNSGLAPGKIAGIVVGIVGGILLIAALAMFIILRRKDKEVAIKLESLEPEAAPTEKDALEHSFDFYTYQISNKEHNRLPHLLQLHEMLVEDNMLLVDTLVAVTDAKDGDMINFVAKSLTYLLETKRTFLPWFERMLQDEVANCLSKETLFRGNNMFTKSMTAYAIMVGTRYLQTTLFEPMQKLSGIADIQSPELDPNRVQDQADMALSKDVLQLLARLIFTALQKSVPNVPIQLHMVCNLIKNIVTRRYPDAEALALGGFFFLRFLNPVIVSPDRFGITKASPDANVRRAELLVSKVMMAIVNGVLFGEKESYMIVLNDFVEQQREPLYKLLGDLAKVDAKPSSVEPVEVPPNVTQVSLVYIHKQIAANIDTKIANFLNCVPPPPPKNYECPRDLQSFFDIHYPKFGGAAPRSPVPGSDQAALLASSSSSLLASSSSSSVVAASDEHTKYTNVLRKLANVSKEEKAARQRLYEKLKVFLEQTGSAPLQVQGADKDGKKLTLV